MFSLKDVIVCCRKLNNTRDCDEHLFQTSWHKNRSLSTAPIPLHKCAPVEISSPTNWGAPYFDDVMSYISLTTM